ncbi:MAG TPA: hypothetical protein VFG23_03700 [Polyangia bacterium]|nr:hypothetical protein [Polyangia bacterium]
MRSEPRRAAAIAAPALPLALCLALSAVGCSSPQSFIVLVVESSPPTPIAHVATLSVVVSKGTTEMKTLTFPANDLTVLSVASDAGVGPGTLSVGFSGGESGDITFAVKALDAQGCDLGDGTTIVTLKISASNEGIVELSPATGCPTDGAAPGTGGMDGGSAFGGCDLVHPQCAVAGQTCQVNCAAKVNSCLTGGAVAAGGVCQSPADCMTGTQCFDYSNLGCAIKICLPFCDGNNDCAAFASGGTGPGSACRDPVICPNSTTAAHTCTFSCDPTAAAATSGGCPSGLACLITGSLDQVDCACPEKTRTAVEGQTCAGAANCAPGQQCNSQGGVQTCRPICRCDAANGVCTAAANDCPTAGTRCAPVSTETIYGICL